MALATDASAIQAEPIRDADKISFFGKELFKSAHSGSLGDDEKWQGLVVRHQRSMPNRLFNELVNDTRGNTFAEKARLVNITVNNKVTGVNDAVNYGKADYWASPAETLQSGRGDCDDYSILKYHALRAQGVPSERLFLASVAINGITVDHMVLVMNVGEKADRFVILDNRVDEMVETRNSTYGFFRALNESGAWEIEILKTMAGTTLSFAENGDLYALDIRAKDEHRLLNTYNTLHREGKRGLELVSTLLDFEMENIENYDLFKNGKLISLDVSADSETLKTKIKHPPKIMDF